MDVEYGGGILYGVPAKHVKIDRPDVGRYRDSHRIYTGYSIGYSERGIET